MRRGEGAPLLLLCIKQPQDSHPVRGLAFDVALQSQSTALPPGCPCGPRCGSVSPRHGFTGGPVPQRTGSHPVHLRPPLSASVLLCTTGRAAHGIEVPPHGTPGYHTVRPATRPVHRAREAVACSWLRLVRSRRTRPTSGAYTPLGVRRGVPDHKTSAAVRSLQRDAAMLEYTPDACSAIVGETNRTARELIPPV